MRTRNNLGNSRQAAAAGSSSSNRCKQEHCSSTHKCFVNSLAMGCGDAASRGASTAEEQLRCHHLLGCTVLSCLSSLTEPQAQLERLAAVQACAN